MENSGWKNIIPPKHGEVRNPNGRPKGSRNRSTIVREMLEAAAVKGLNSSVDLGVEMKTIFDQLVAQQVYKAYIGDTTAFKELADSAYGKLVDKVDTTHSFTKMGNVKAALVDKTKTIEHAPAVDLTFDVGKDPESEPADVSDDAD